MDEKGFSCLNKSYQWEMCIICYVSNDKMKNINPNDNITSYKACGLGNYFGNKGAVHISFSYQERLF